MSPCKQALHFSLTTALAVMSIKYSRVKQNSRVAEAEESYLENLRHSLTTGSCFLTLKWDRQEGVYASNGTRGGRVKLIKLRQKWNKW